MWTSTSRPIGRRRIPVGLVAATLVLLTLAGMSQADPSAAGAPSQRTRVALADVSDGSHYKHMDLSEPLEMGLVAAMLGAERIDIAPEEDVTAALEELGCEAPLEDSELQRLGEAVGAQVVVAARCIEARYDDFAKHAVATVRVRILDTRAGLAVRTCQVRGESMRNGHPLGERQLIENALDEAAYSAVTELGRNLTIVGAVSMALDAERVRVNLTSEQGVVPGTMLEVWDNGRKMATLRVTESTELGSVCEITDGADPDDLAPGMTVYVTEFPSPDAPAEPEKEGKKHHSKWGTVVAVILGIGLLYLAYKELTRDRSGGGLTAGFRGIQNRAQVQSGQEIEFEVSITNRQGQPVPDDTEVVFGLREAASATARIRQTTPYLGSIESPKMTADGVASTTFVAGEAGQSVEILVKVGGFTSSIIVDIVAGSPATITLTSSATTITANGATSTIITATVTDGSGNPVLDGTLVDFAASSGELTMTSVPTTGGVASTTLRSTQTAGPVTVTASVNGVSSQPLIVTFSPGAPSQVILSATKTNLRAGDGRATITAQVLDAFGNSVPDTTQITFGAIPTTGGTFSQTTMTTVSGQAATEFIAGATPQLVTVTCEAIDPSETPPLPVQGTLELNIAGSTPDDIQLLVSPATAPADGVSTITVRATLLQSGNPVADGTSVSFELVDNNGGAAAIRSRDLVTKDGQALALVASTAAGGATVRVTAPTGTAAAEDAAMTFTGLPANAIILAVGENPIRIGEDNAGHAPEPGLAATTITATLTDESGRPVTDGTTVDFKTTLGSVSPGQAQTTGGQATVTYTSLATGVATITAESGDVTATTTIQVLAGPAAALTLVADPLAVRADGNSFATVTCTVVDASGNLVDDGTRVEFLARNRAVDGTTPRVFVTPEGRTVGGMVQAILVSKLADEATGDPIEQASPPGSVFVNATVPVDQEYPIPPPASPIQNGIADVQFVSQSVSDIALGVLPINVRGLDVVGNESTATALVYDDQHNPVPDGTAVYFSISHGMIRGNAGTVGGVAQSYSANGVATATILTPGGLETGVLNDPAFDGFVDIIVSVGGPPGATTADGLQREFTDAILYSGPAFTVDPSDAEAGPTTVTGSKDTLAQVGDRITYTIVVLDENENPVVDGTEVKLATDKGVLEESTVRTVGGVALATLYSTKSVDDDPVALGPGTVTVTIPRGSGHPALIFNLPFTVESLAGSGVSLSPSTLDFGDVDTQRTVAIQYSGSETLDWTASASASWISVAPASGTGTGVLTVTVNRAGLMAGDYVGTVIVTTSEGTASATVEMTVP